MSVYKQKEDDLDKIFHDLNRESDEESEDDNEKKIGEEVKPPDDDIDKRNLTDETIITLDTSSGSVQDDLVRNQSIDIQDNDGVIFIDSDDDEDDDVPREVSTSASKPKLSWQPSQKSPTIDLSFEEQPSTSKTIMIDYDFNLKVLVSGIYKQFKTTFRTPLKVALREMIAELSSHGKSLIVYRSDNQPISLDESPFSLNLSPGNILNAIEIASTELSDQQTKETVIEVDPDIITLKLQDGHLRHLKEFKINRHDRLFKLKEQYAQHFDLDIESMKLNFDGDPVDDDSTAEEMDIEDGCVLDVLIARSK